MILNIVMVEPEIPQNAGNVARTCAATGARLHLVGPMGFKIDDKKLKRAGLDYWHLLDITYYDSLDEFFAKNSGEFFFFSTKSVHKHTDIHYPDNCYLFFGKETAGLPEEVKVEWAKKIPLRRGGTPEDVANIATFLASDMSSYVSGQVIQVDGGMNMYRDL